MPYYFRVTTVIPRFVGWAGCLARNQNIHREAIQHFCRLPFAFYYCTAKIPLAYRFLKVKINKANINGEMAMETCANCGRTIGNLEQQSVWQNKAVCLECKDRLTKKESKDPAANQTDDAVVYSAHPCMFRARPFSFILCIILVPVGVGLIIFLVWWLRCRAATLTITRQRLIYITGILSKNTDEIWLNDVRDS